MDTLSVEVSRIVREYRFFHGWSNREIADALCMSRSSLSSKLSGARRWTASDCKALRKAGVLTSKDLEKFKDFQ